MRPNSNLKWIRTIDQARAAGYTRAVYADCQGEELDLLVKQDADIDDEFIAYDVNENEFIKVYGWLLDVKDDDD